MRYAVGDRNVPDEASVRYREATALDAEDMAHIRALGGWTGGAPAGRMTAYLAGTHHPRYALAPRVAFVAEDAGTLVGFIAGHLTRRFTCDGELEWIFVAPERRGSEVGSELLRRLAGWFVAHDARRVCVDVDPANLRARHVDFAPTRSTLE